MAGVHRFTAHPWTISRFSSAWAVWCETPDGLHFFGTTTQPGDDPSRGDLRRALKVYLRKRKDNLRASERKARQRLAVVEEELRLLEGAE